MLYTIIYITYVIYHICLVVYQGIFLFITDYVPFMLYSIYVVYKNNKMVHNIVYTKYHNLHSVSWEVLNNIFVCYVSLYDSLYDHSTCFWSCY